MELRPGLVMAKTVSTCKEQGPGHWVSIVMMTSEAREVSKTYGVRDESTPFKSGLVSRF